MYTAPHTLVMGVSYITGAVNLTFNIQFPLADKFRGWPLICLKSIHRPQRALQHSENEIMKLHTILEMSASNPILKTHFYELGEPAVCRCLTFYGVLYALRNGRSLTMFD